MASLFIGDLGSYSGAMCPPSTILYQISNSIIIFIFIYIIDISTMPKCHASRVFHTSLQSMATKAQVCYLIFQKLLTLP